MTYGTTTGVDDAHPTPFDNVIGEHQLRLPKGGVLPASPNPGRVFYSHLNAIPASDHFAGDFKLVRWRRADQQAEINEQKPEVEVQQMKEKLERLRAQMTDDTGRKGI